MGIRMMSFLTLTLLASGCSGTTCSCKCLFPEAKKSGYACDLINKLQTSEDTNKVTINELVKGTTELQEEMEKMQSMVSSLLTSQSELQRDLSSLVKTDIGQPFEKLTHLTKEIEKEEAKQVELEKNLSQCFGKISGLDGVVNQHVQTSSFEHQRLRSEMVGQVTQLKAECATRSVVDNRIASLSADLQETQENLKELGKMVNCKDFLPAHNCMNKVLRNRCHVPNIAFRCCASCAKAKKK